MATNSSFKNYNHYIIVYYLSIYLLNHLFSEDFNVPLKLCCSKPEITLKLVLACKTRWDLPASLCYFLVHGHIFVFRNAQPQFCLVLK